MLTRPNIYLGILLLSPIINKGIDYLTKNQFKILIIALIYLQTTYIIFGTNYLSTTGHSIYSMLVIYLLGRYFRIYDVQIKKPFILFILFTFALFLSVYFISILGYQSIAWRFLTYNSLFIIIASILLFYTFKELKIKHYPIINKIATFSFGVYLFHESESMKIIIAKIPVYISPYINNGLILIFSIILISIVTYLFGSVIERFRIFVSQPIFKYISKQINKITL
jgi:peptidoglycan/LPS O-acetylase OafA/YrhL